jgi:hypothetical protein
MKKKTLPKKKSFVSKLLIISGLAFIIGTVIPWLPNLFIYVQPADYVPMTYTGEIGLESLMFLIIFMGSAICSFLGIIVFAILLVFSPKLLYKFAGLLFFFCPLIGLLTNLGGPGGNLFQIYNPIGFLLMIMFYFATPVILAIFTKPRNNFFIIVSIVSISLFVLTIISGIKLGLSVNSGVFYFGSASQIDINNVFSILMYLPIFALIWYLAFSAKKLGIVKE